MARKVVSVIFLEHARGRFKQDDGTVQQTGMVFLRSWDNGDFEVMDLCPDGFLEDVTKNINFVGLALPPYSTEPKA